MLIGFIDTDFVKDAVSLGEIVHHKSYVTKANIFNPSITINFDNLELLCYNCHNNEHISKFDEQGQIKPKEENILELAGILKK